MIDFIRKINAAKKFSIKDDFEFIEFDDISSEHTKEHETVPDLLEIWAAVKINFEGEIPESYKTLNLMIGDWVEKNIKPLTNIIHEKLKEHFEILYPGSDKKELGQLDETAIWTDQLDYMPIIRPDEKSFVVEIELVLHAELIGK